MGSCHLSMEKLAIGLYLTITQLMLLQCDDDQSLCLGATLPVPLPLELPGNQNESESGTEFLLRPVSEVFQDQEHFQQRLWCCHTSVLSDYAACGKLTLCIPRSSSDPEKQIGGFQLPLLVNRG